MRTPRIARVLAVAALATALFAVPAVAVDDNDAYLKGFRLSYGDPDASVNTAGGTSEDGETITAKAKPGREWCNFSGRLEQAWATHWWWFEGSGRAVTISTVGSNFDTIFGIYDEGFDDPQITCVDRLDRQTNETFTFDTVAGTYYDIQVGGCVYWDVNTGPTFCSPGPGVGSVRIVATTPAPGNDSRAAAAGLATGQRTSGDNYGATEEAGETLKCSSERGANLSFGRTVWYRWTAPAVGRAIFSSSGIDTVLTVYRDGQEGLPKCDEPANPAAASRVEVAVSPGDYLLQVGGFGLHNGATFDDSSSGAISVLAEFTENTDRDGDGVTNNLDCQPDNRNIPTAEVPQNGVDDDCKDGDAPYPKLSSSTRGRANWAFYRRYTKLTKLVAEKVPAGSRVEVRCSGRSCRGPRSRAISVAADKARVSLLTRALKAMKIKPTTTIQVRITKAGFVGRVKTFRFRRLRRDPRETDTCLAVGATADVACASLPG